MRNLFLMSLFAMMVTTAWGGQSIFNVSIVISAYADEVAFSCPGGLTSCYRADGSEYIDVNALNATASGDDEGESGNDVNALEATASGDDKGHVIQVVQPQHFRSF